MYREPPPPPKSTPTLDEMDAQMKASPAGGRFVLSALAMAAFEAESKRHLGRDQGSGEVYYRGVRVVMDPEQVTAVRLEE